MSKIILLDNYDSFTYNLVQYIEELTQTEISVSRNNKIDVEEIGDYDTIVLSPGPGLPHEAGILLDVIKKYAHTKRILGVCLGHQAIIESFGGSIRNLEKVYHGVATEIHQTDIKSMLFTGIPDTYLAGRYHSWSASVDQIPDELEVTALDNQNEVMAIQHKSLPIYGVQYHPESIMTSVGKKILANFLQISYEISKEDYALENATIS